MLQPGSIVNDSAGQRAALFAPASVQD